MRTIIWIILLIIIVLGGWLLLRGNNTDNTNMNIATTTDNSGSNTDNTGTNSGSNNGSNGDTETQTSDIVVTNPKAGDTISSPLSVSGKARGSWYFEASAPVKVIDASGKVLGTGHIQAQGEWMTTDYVPFSGTITFNRATTTSTSTTGFVVFENDNPSGDPARSKSVSIPVKFR